MKNTKRSLITSLVTLLLCSAMFVGSSFAWFTDTVSNTGNKIQAGTLKIGLEQYKANQPGTAGSSGHWVDISNNAEPIFNYNKWEPGYSQYAVLRVTNNGNLALKYKLLLNVNGTLELNENGHSIADAIDVYGFKTLTEETALAAYNKASFNEFKEITGVANLGTLSSLLFDEDGAAYGVLLPNGATNAQEGEVVGSAYAVICLHMREDAGNEYQDMKLADSFDIVVNASQYTFEEDGFNSKDYDFEANGNPDHPEFDNPTYPITKLPINTTVVKEEGKVAYEITRGEQTIELPSGMKIKYPAGVPLTTDAATKAAGDSTNKADQGFEFISKQPAVGSITVKSLVEDDRTKAVAQYKLTLPIDSTKNDASIAGSKLIKTADKIAPGYVNLRVFHNDVEIAEVNDFDATPSVESFYYKPETGEFILWVYHSSPIEFVYDVQSEVPEGIVAYVTRIKDSDLVVNCSDLSEYGVYNGKLSLDCGYIFSAFNPANDLGTLQKIYANMNIQKMSDLFLLNVDEIESYITDAIENNKITQNEADHLISTINAIAPYANWDADFVVTFDKEISANSAYLTGYYEAYCHNINGGNWIALTDTVPANTPVRLLADGMGLSGFATYQVVCGGITVFKCGAINMSEKNTGTVMTVELKLFNPEDESDSITIAKYSHTFVSPEDHAKNDLAIDLAAAKNIIEKINENYHEGQFTEVPIESMDYVTRYYTNDGEKYNSVFWYSEHNPSTTYYKKNYQFAGMYDDGKYTASNGYYTEDRGSTWKKMS